MKCIGGIGGGVQGSRHPDELDFTCAFFSQMRRQEPESLENGMTMRLA